MSTYDETIMDVLMSIKSDIDQKVYDKNDILKKDAYFEQTVMQQIKIGMDNVGVSSAREDRKFIQSNCQTIFRTVQCNILSSLKIIRRQRNEHKKKKQWHSLMH